MRLLILTQKVDINDPILGFFHRWIEEFAKHCESVTVVALGVGGYDLPKNVHVFSLGKEQGVSRFRYVYNFYRLIWRERKNYDAVFVHMNQEYVLLGGLLWKLLGKKVTMWRNHFAGNFFTQIAVTLSDKMFCTSEYSYTAQYKKTSIMPVGIDTGTFFRDKNFAKKEHSILFLGRISPVKKVDVLIAALDILDKEGVIFIAGIYGNSADKDKEYYEKIRALAAGLEKKGKVIFYDGVSNSKTPLIYNQYEFFVSATPSGSLDKTIFEAMACECIVVASNESLKGVLPEQFLFKETDAVDLAKKLREAMRLSESEKTGYQTSVRQYAEQHNLSHLMQMLLALIGRTDKD